MRRPVPDSANSAASLTLGILSAVSGSSWSAEVAEAPSNGDALADIQTIQDEAGLEAFYDFQLTPWCHVGADLQVIRPGLGESTAVIPGLRAVIRL